MKKKYHYFAIFLLFGLLGVSSSAFAHSVQVGYCVNCEGVLRIYVEHWHGDAVGATTMDIELDVGGVVTTVQGEPAGFISDTVKSDLPDCATPLTVFGECPPAAAIPAFPGIPAVAGQCGANTCNYWVVYDFPSVQKGVPIKITILSGNNQFTEDGCSMFPASPPVFVIPLSIVPSIDVNQTVCSGSSASINLVDFTGNLQWQSSSTSGGPWNDIPGSTITPLSTGSLSSTTFYQAVVTGDCGTVISGESSVVVNQGTPSDAGDDISTCPTTTPGNLGAIPVPGAIYSWAPATGLNSTTVANPTVDLSSIMNITYTLTTTAAGCNPTTDEVTVIVSNDLAVTVNSPDLCFGETATITASGATTYSWSPATDLNTTTGATVICSAPGSTTYTVTGTSNGCVGTAVSTVTMNPTPSSNAGADISICSGETATIGAPATPGYIYSWSPSADLSSSVAANPTVTPTNYTGAPINLTYEVTTSPAGCFSTDEVVVTVNPATDPTFSYSPTTYCQGGGGTDPSPTIVAAGGTFTSAPGGLVIDANSGLVNIAASTIATYTVTYSHGGACPSSSSLNLFTVTSIPDASFSYGSYCQNEPNPSPAFPVGASAGIFSAGPGLVFADPTTGEVDLEGSTPGDYTVTNTISAGGGCPSAVSTNTITVNAVPITTMDTPVICNGEVATITAGGADTYVWSDGSSAGTLSVSPTTGTNYTVTGTSAGCSSSVIGAVVVNPIPPVGANDATICLGVMANLTATGASTYSWSTGSGSPNLSISPSATTTYTVTGTALGCSASAISAVTVIDPPVVTVNSEPICAGSSATLIASGANAYVWMDDNSTQNTRSVSPALSTQYTVTGASGGCSSTAMADVTVNPVPTSPFTVTAACIGLGSTITYTGNAPSNATYTWDFDGGTIISGSGQGPYSVSWPSAGNPNVTLTVSIGSCISPLTTMPVTIYPLPDVTVASKTICYGDAGTLTGSGASTYTWSTGAPGASLTISPTLQTSYTVTGTSTNGCIGTATATIDVDPLPDFEIITDTVCEGFNATLIATGTLSYLWSNGGIGSSITVSPVVTSTFSVTGTDANGCMLQISDTVIVYPKPHAQFSSSPTNTGFYDPIISFNNQSSNDVTSWYWVFGDGDTLDTNTANPIHTYPGDTATYTAFLKVGNPGGCYDSISHMVVIGPEYSLYIPNAFSPNADGKNEVFTVRAEGVEEFEMMIYDRWGNFIFYTTDLDTGWNGDYMGNPSQEDVYVYSINVIDVRKKEHTYRGTVSLIK